MCVLAYWDDVGRFIIILSFVEDILCCLYHLCVYLHRRLYYPDDYHVPKFTYRSIAPSRLKNCGTFRNQYITLNFTPSLIHTPLLVVAIATRICNGRETVTQRQVQKAITHPAGLKGQRSKKMESCFD